MEKRSCIHVLLFLLPTCTVFSQWEMAQLEIYKVRKFQTYLWNTSFAMIASTNNGLLFCLMNNVWVAGIFFFIKVHLCEVCFACDGFSWILFQEVRYNIRWQMVASSVIKMACTIVCMWILIRLSGLYIPVYRYISYSPLVASLCIKVEVSVPCSYAW